MEAGCTSDPFVSHKTFLVWTLLVAYPVSVSSFFLFSNTTPYCLGNPSPMQISRNVSHHHMLPSFTLFPSFLPPCPLSFLFHSFLPSSYSTVTKLGILGVLMIEKGVKRNSLFLVKLWLRFLMTLPKSPHLTKLNFLMRNLKA